MRSQTAIRFLVLWTALLTCLAAPAFAREKDPRVVQAQADCLSGKTDSGVALLAQLYAESHNPNFIYNQARCYEQALRPDDAIGRFREYLRVAKNLPPAEKADVEKHIDECRTLKAEQDRDKEKQARATAGATAAATPAPPVSALPTPAAPPPTVTSPAPEATPGALDLTAQPASAESTPLYKKWWFWTGIGAVVAAGVVTTVLLLTRSSNPCDGASHSCLEI